MLQVLGVDDRTSGAPRAVQNKRIPEGKSVETMEINCAQDVVHAHGRNAKLGEQLDLLAGMRRRRPELLCSSDEVFLEHLRRNRASSRRPWRCSKEIASARFYRCVRVIGIDQN